MDIGQLHRLVGLDRGCVFANLIGVSHGNAHGRDPLIRPDGVQQALIGRELLFLEVRHMLGHIVQDVVAGAGHLLHGDQADTSLVAGIKGTVERGVFVQPGAVLNHDGVYESTLGSRFKKLGPLLVVA